MSKKTIELEVEVPENIEWDDLTELEDDVSEAVGDVLKKHGLVRNSHKRKIEADYSSWRADSA